MKIVKIILLIYMVMFLNNGFAVVPKVIDKISVIVNNDIILESDINSVIQSIKLNPIRPNQDYLNDTTNFRHQILESLILDQIVLQIGQKIGIKVSDEQIKQAISIIANQNKMTIDQMDNHLAKNGINYHNYRNQIRKKMVISEVRNNEVVPRISILPEEIDTVIQQLDKQNGSRTELNLSYILIPFPEDSTSDQIATAENQARSIFEQSKIGIDFCKLAITGSSTQQNLKVGQINWKSIQELPSVFEQSLKTAKKGDIIGLIRSEIGFYILKVNDVRACQKNIFVTEVHIRHILLKTSSMLNDHQAISKLQQISANIKSGKISFIDAAKKFSHDLTSSNEGGDLGWWSTINIYDPILQNVLLHLHKGKISDPIHSSFGWHLIELVDIRHIKKTTDTLKKDIYHMLFNRKFSREADMWIQEQRVSSYVKVLEN